MPNETSLAAVLVRPSAQYAASYLAALREALPESKIPPAKIDEMERDFPAHLAKLESRRNGDEFTEYVPQHTFWLVEGERFIGFINVRTRLTEKLARIGGHIGYEVRPSARGRGYASQMLGLALSEARTLGVERVLITCDEENIGSRKVIENNGGRAPERATIPDWPKPILRYWIHL